MSSERYARCVVRSLQQLSLQQCTEWLDLLESSDPKLHQMVAHALSERQPAIANRRQLTTSNAFATPTAVFVISDDTDETSGYDNDDIEPERPLARSAIFHMDGACIVIDDDDDDQEDRLPRYRPQQPSIFLDLVSEVEEEEEEEEAVPEEVVEAEEDNAMEVETPPPSPQRTMEEEEEEEEEAVVVAAVVVVESIEVEPAPSDARGRPRADDDDDPYARHMRYQSLMQSPITAREFDAWVDSM